MSETLQLRNENDYVLTYLRLVPQDPSKTPDGQGYFDFKAQMIEFSFEESVFEVGVHGSLFVKDSVDYPTLLPFIGEERLRASFTRPDETSKEGDLLPPIEFDLPIYQMGGRDQHGASRKSQTYTLYYGSDSVFTNINKYVCRTFKDKPYSDMVQIIYDDFLKEETKKPIEIEKTKFSTNYTVNNLTPFAAIRKLSKRSISDEGNGYYYVFFEDRDKFYFTTLNKLAKQAPVRTLTYQLKNIAEDTAGISYKPKKLGMYNVYNLQNHSNIDAIGSALSGEGASSLLSVDPVRRKFALRAFDLRGEASQESHKMPLVPNSKWDAIPHTGKGKPWTEKNKMFVNPLANKSMLISDAEHEIAPYISTRDTEARSYYPEEFYLQRQSNKVQMMKHVISCSISGDPTLRAGCVVKFEHPEFLGKTSEQFPEEKDKYLQGNYLVVSCAHVLKKGSYTTNLELVKDSFFSDIEARDPVEEYKGIY